MCATVWEAKLPCSGFVENEESRRLDFGDGIRCVGPRAGSCDLELVKTQLTEGDTVRVRPIDTYWHGS